MLQLTCRRARSATSRWTRRVSVRQSQSLRRLWPLRRSWLSSNGVSVMATAKSLFVLPMLLWLIALPRHDAEAQFADAAPEQPTAAGDTASEGTLLSAEELNTRSEERRVGKEGRARRT